MNPYYQSREIYDNLNRVEHEEDLTAFSKTGLSYEEREKRWHERRWLNEPEVVADDWLFQPLPMKRKDHNEIPEGAIVHHLEVYENNQREAFPTVHSQTLWSYSELSKQEIEDVLKVANPKLVLLSMTVKDVEFDEF